MRRILVIDDEARIRRLLELALSVRGWEVFQAESGFEGLEATRAYKPDVVLLDLSLPDMDGRQVLERLRAWSTVPVIVVSVRDAEADIVGLLESGADDYVTKPFYTNELLARAEAAFRRRQPGLDPVLRTGRIVVDMERRMVLAGGETIHLRPTEYSLLSLLARHAGKVLTRDSILRELWGPAGESEEGNLRVQVNALRRKIERDPARPELLVTEAGVGYRLELLPAEEEPADRED